MAADIVQGYKDGGVNAEAVVQEVTCYFLDSLIFGRWEKWCGRLLGGLLMCWLAVNGVCSVVRGMFWAFWGFVVEFIEGLFHVAQHRDVDISFGIFRGKGKAAVLFPFSID